MRVRVLFLIKYFNKNQIFLGYLITYSHYISNQINPFIHKGTRILKNRVSRVSDRSINQSGIGL